MLDNAQALLHPYEFNIYDTFSVSPNKIYIAYTVRHKLPDSNYPSSITMENGTLYPHTGCEIWLIHLPTQQSKMISSANSWQPAWSHDSNKIAFYSDKGGNPQVWIYSLEEDSAKQISQLAVKDSSLRHHKTCWSQDDKTLYYPGRCKNHNNNTLKPESMIKHTIKNYFSPSKTQGTGFVHDANDTDNILLKQFLATDIVELHLSSRTTKIVIHEEHVSQPTCSYIGLSGNDNYLCYLSAHRYSNSSLYYHTSLWAYPLTSSQEPILIDEIEISNNPLDQPPCLWMPNSNKLLYIKSGTLYLVDLSDPTHLIRSIYYKDDNYHLTTSFFQWALDNNQLIISAAKKTRIDKTVCLLIVEKDKRPLQLNLDQHPEYDGIKAVIQIKHTELTIVSRNINTEETSLLQFNLQDTTDDPISHYKQITKIHSVQNSYCSLGVLGAPANIISLSNNQWISYYESPACCGNLYLFDEKFNPITRLTDINPQLLSLPKYTIQVIQTTLVTRFGKELTVNTAVLLPVKKTKGTIVCVYPSTSLAKSVGQYGAGSIASVPNWVYLQQGYAVILADLPWNLDASIAHPLEELTSILTPQIDAICTQCNLDKNKMGLIGHSWGGYAAAGIICITPLFKAAVASSGLYDLAASHGYIHDDGAFYGRRFLELEYFGMGHAPWDNLNRYIYSSPYYLADKITTPLLILHGSTDIICPVVEAEKLFAALERLNKVSELVIYKDEEHGVKEWKNDHYIDYIQRIIRHFNQYII